MIDRRLFLSAALALVSAPAFAQQAPASPLDAVKRVYDPKVKDAQRPYSARLKRLYAAAQRKSRQINEPVSGLDFDPTTNSQDADDDFRKSLTFSVEPRPGGNALVIVKLKVFKDAAETVLHYEIVPEGQGFAIDDIVNPAKTEGWRWSKMLEAGAKGQ